MYQKPGLLHQRLHRPKKRNRNAWQTDLQFPNLPNEHIEEEAPIRIFERKLVMSQSTVCSIKKDYI